MYKIYILTFCPHTKVASNLKHQNKITFWWQNVVLSHSLLMANPVGFSRQELLEVDLGTLGFLGGHSSNTSQG